MALNFYQAAIEVRKNGNGARFADVVGNFVPSREKIPGRAELWRGGDRDDFVTASAAAVLSVRKLENLAALCIQNAHASTFSGLSMRISESAVTRFPAQR